MSLTASDTIQIIIAVVALFGQAVGLIIYGAKIVSKLKEGSSAELKAQQEAHLKATELLHSRINNIRKEFVTGDLYQRDLTEMKQGMREILGAIHTLGETMTAKVSALDKTDGIQEFRLMAIDDKINGRNVGRGSQVT